MRAQFDRGVWLIVLITLVVVLVLYQSLPQSVAIHYGIDGRPDRYGHPAVIAFLPLCAALPVVLFMSALPFFGTISKAASPRVLAWIARAVVLLLAILHVWMMLAAIEGLKLPAVSGFALLGVALLVMGNFLGKIQRNTLIGIRTPWTLASDEVWYRTHRVGAKVTVAGGFVIVMIECLPIPLVWKAGMGIAAFFVTALIPCVYSYRIRHANGHRQNGTDSVTP